MTLDNRHWTIRDFEQRMSASEWRKVLLAYEDKITFRGHAVRLFAREIFPGVYTITKNISSEPDEEERT